MALIVALVGNLVVAVLVRFVAIQPCTVRHVYVLTLWQTCGKLTVAQVYLLVHLVGDDAQVHLHGIAIVYPPFGRGQQLLACNVEHLHIVGTEALGSVLVGVGDVVNDVNIIKASLPCLVLIGFLSGHEVHILWCSAIVHVADGRSVGTAHIYSLHFSSVGTCDGEF